ncbi:hypothetical protein GCM10018952_31230 [Streptosporangium vulgare]
MPLGQKSDADNERYRSDGSRASPESWLRRPIDHVREALRGKIADTARAGTARDLD